VSFLRRTVQVVAVAYMAALLCLLYLSRDLTIANLARDPFFATYSLAVVAYVLGRFVVSLGYRPLPDQGNRPMVSIIIPAFNEEDGIIGTLASCFESEYPDDRFEVIVVNDGSTDATWDRILDAKARWPRLYAVDLGRNYGKRGAMAEGMRRARGEVFCFVDSDSYLDADCLRHLVAPFTDPRVGAVVGHADVRNRTATAWTRMQAVRYWSAFRVIKATESQFGGTVVCASGCCAAYRAAAVLPLLDDWEFQTFLGRPATFGDDRALTNRVLRTWRVTYQENALAETTVPERLGVFFRQQLRWKKSWLRENLYVVRFMWRKHPLGALFTYAGVAFPFIAPFVVVHAVLNVAHGALGTLWFYAVGSYAMALLYSLYYLARRPDGLWFHGVTFVGLYMTVLVFQTYWGMFTMRDTRWGTRASTVDHAAIDQQQVTAMPPAPPPARAELTLALAGGFR
jgi:hyaluronan synthase